MRPADARTADPDAGRRRVVIEDVTPCIDGGRFPVKRARGEQVVVEAAADASPVGRMGILLENAPTLLVEMGKEKGLNVYLRVYPSLSLNNII